MIYEKTESKNRLRRTLETVDIFDVFSPRAQGSALRTRKGLIP